MAHWTRKSYTNVKVQLMLAGVSPLTLTAMDSGFMFTYAGGSFITGQLGDRFSPVAVIGGGLLGSTICLLLIIFGASTSIISNVALCGTWFLTCQMLHGAFQATGGPVRAPFPIPSLPTPPYVIAFHIASLLSVYLVPAACTASSLYLSLVCCLPV